MNNSTAFVRPAMFKSAALALLSLSATLASAQSTHSIFPLLPPSVSTVPSNGDVNPYGVAFVPKTIPTGGVLQPGDILVSNFNNSANLQGQEPRSSGSIAPARCPRSTPALERGADSAPRSAYFPTDSY